MKPFAGYAQFYDLFYKEKEYEKEARFVLAVAEKHGLRSPSSILDLGCGTGGHLVEFARKGLSVAGVDRSHEMIELAMKKIAAEKLTAKIRAVQGDVTTYRDGARYDIVVSMFAVMGYLTKTEDLLRGFATAREHLRPSGVFVFDVWFGPTVLNELPETRIQEFVDKGKSVIRLVRPSLNVVRQTVDVHYDIFSATSEDTFRRINEVHSMRFFFIEELKVLLASSGLSFTAASPFMDDSRPPRLGDWNISVVARPENGLTGRTMDIRED